MAKIGTPEQGGFDPFSAISESLSDLSAPAAVEAAPAAAPPLPKKRVVPPPPKPVVVETPQPEPTVHADPQASSGAVAERVPQPRPPAKTVSATSALQITKRFKTTRREASDLEAAAIHMGAALGVSVDFSKLTRALWEVYIRHQDDILRNVPEDEIWERPANNDAAGLAELDQRLADLINDGLMVACRRPKNTR